MNGEQQVVRWRILFVDDEPHVLKGLERLLHPMRREWDMLFAEGGAQALEKMNAQPVDIIVTDLWMPGMDGAQLLAEVKRRFPRMIRVVLSGQVERETALRSVELTHQFIAKPCEAQTLIGMISRSIALHRILEDESLKQMISGMEALPTLPSLYLDIMKEIQSENGSLARIGQIIATDIGMSAKILQLVNSAFFGLPNAMANPAQAAIYLGLDTIRALVLSVHIFSRFAEGRLAGIGLDALWRHSMTVATSAKEIVALEGGGQAAMDFAFVAGLLHDVGKIVLAVNLPDRYQRVAEAAEKLKLSDVEAERRIFSVTHAEIGAYLLGIWGLQDPLVEAVCFHHNPDASPNLAFSPLMAVHVANSCYSEALVGGTVANCTKLDINYLNKIGRGERLPVWFEACRTIAQKGGSDGGKNSVR